MRRALLSIAVLTLLAGLLAGSPAASAPVVRASSSSGAASELAEVLTPAARRALAAAGRDDLVRVVVTLDDQLDLARLAADGLEEGEAVEALQEHAAREQALIRLLAPIWELGPAVGDFEPFWIVNGFALSARVDVITIIAGLPGVAEIDVEQSYVLAGTAPTGPVAANVDRIGAPTAWAAGHTGEGVVVAVLDTGVDVVGIPGVFPSEVANSYRGGTNSWFDPYNGTTEPYDPSGHGTAVTSIIAGGGASGENVGVAPDAQWIAAKVFDDSGRATTSAIRGALQWVLDPDGDPATDDGADIVNASWTSAAAGCDLEFAGDIAALRAAGVLPVFAGGNHGPLPGSAPSPSNLPGVLAVGSLDAADVALPSSSRGPTDCGGAIRTYPHISAPGQNITAQTIQGQFIPHDGTSFAAPHVAGAAAVLTEAIGGADADRIEAALLGGARDLDVPGPDDSTGAGIVDLPAALDALGLGPDPEGPTVGSIAGSVHLDADRSGDASDGDVPSVGVQVSLLGPGPDATWDTDDDLVVAEAVTGAAGGYSFVGLEPGPVRVRLDLASLPATAIPVGDALRSVAIEAGVEKIVEFRWQHPAPGSVVVTVVDDGVGSGGAPSPLAGVSVTLDAAGVDGIWSTADDTTVAAATDAAGQVRFDDVAAGEASVTIDRETLPERGYVIGANRYPVVVPSSASATVDVAVRVPAESRPLVALSMKRAGEVGGLPYRDEDVLAWDGTRFTMLFDGSDVGLATRDLDAVHLVDASTLLLSVDRTIELPDVGVVSDGDVLRFDATQLGEHTRGTFSIAWRSVDEPMLTTAGDVDAVTMVDDDIVVSVRGNVRIGDRLIRDEDLVVANADGTLGALVFDGSEAELRDRAEDVDAAAMTPTGTWWVSTLGTARVTGLLATDGDVLACDGSPCQWTLAFDAGDLGLADGDLDALSFPIEGEER